jgi:hypothetical protein
MQWLNGIELSRRQNLVFTQQKNELFQLTARDFLAA